MDAKGPKYISNCFVRNANLQSFMAAKQIEKAVKQRIKKGKLHESIKGFIFRKDIIVENRVN